MELTPLALQDVTPPGVGCVIAVIMYLTCCLLSLIDGCTHSTSYLDAPQYHKLCYTIGSSCLLMHNTLHLDFGITFARSLINGVYTVVMWWSIRVGCLERLASESSRNSIRLWSCPISWEYFCLPTLVVYCCWPLVSLVLCSSTALYLITQSAQRSSRWGCVPWRFLRSWYWDHYRRILWCNLSPW